MGLFDIRKQVRGAVLGWFWLFAKPAVYIFVFWFALAIGIKTGNSVGDKPYILWLMGGLIPWFYMQKQLTIGIDTFARFPYLVTKIKFPLAAIPTIYNVSELVIHTGLAVVLLIAYFICGQGLDIHLIQLPFAILIMAVFWNMVSTTASMLSTMSKDFKNLMKTLSTPLFWLSGIIFDVSAIGYDWIQNILLFNPVTFFATWYRSIFYDQTWIWENPTACLAMLAVFVVTLTVMLLVYKRVRKDIPDVL